MRYSKLFGKTTKDIPKDIQLTSHQLLYKAGFIRESVAGRYFFLPLGMRVRNKIIQIIREEMDLAGSQEMIVPVLHPLELWQETNRDQAAGFELMRIKDRRNFWFALGGTAEEMFVDVVRKFPVSYKDLPFSLYQFSSKFRDELRARGGLLRAREFLMKDAYSFDLDETSFKQEYHKMSQTYTKIFKRLGLDTAIVEADNGYIGGEYCHEFVVLSGIGESKFLESEDGAYRAHEEIARFKLEPVNPEEAEKPMEIISQPEWVHTMEDNFKHYDRQAKFFLKNVVYRNHKGKLIIAVIRGDLDVNPIKLGHLLGESVPLTEASVEDLNAIGTKPGYVHSWSHQNVTYVADLSLYTVKNFIGGQKKASTDSINVNYGRDFKHETEGDIALAQTGFLAPDGKQKLMAKRGIEVGNIFQLGYHYSKRMKDAVYVAQDGQKKPYYMGCYGIGIERTLQTIAEIHHDDKGIGWPSVVAPFQVYLIDLTMTGQAQVVQKIYQQLMDKGIEVLWDDRSDVSAGQKFVDADLIGCPVRLVVSKKTGDKIEWKKRNDNKTELLSYQDVIERLK